MPGVSDPDPTPVLADGPSTRVFVLGLQHDDGSLVASELYDAGATVGFTVHQIRLCLARLVREGAFVQEGRGRKAVLAATEQHRRFADPELDFLAFSFRQDAGLEPWDGRWRLVGFSIDEERRHLRNELRSVIVALGGAAVFGGMYAHTVVWDGLLRSIAADLGVADRVVMLETDSLDIGGVSDPAELVRLLWPIDEIAQRYRQFEVRFEDVDDLAGGDVNAALALAVTLGASFDACIRKDPLLPLELLGPDWPGTRARSILRRSARAVAKLRADAGVPALFSRYDSLFDALDAAGSSLDD